MTSLCVSGCDGNEEPLPLPISPTTYYGSADLLFQTVQSPSSRDCGNILQINTIKLFVEFFALFKHFPAEI